MQTLRIFNSSPDDVADERKIAGKDIVDELRSPSNPWPSAGREPRG
jgi:hypothetical protein